jgi:elongation factor Ts
MTRKFGVVASYVHPDGQFGAMVELSCESRVAALSHSVRMLASELAMQVAATGPVVLSREELSEELRVDAFNVMKGQALDAGRSEPQAGRIAAIRMENYHSDSCLLEQPVLQEPSLTVRELLRIRGAAMNELIAIVRFARFAINETAAAGGAST